MHRQRGLPMVALMVSLTVVLIILGAATTAYLKLLRTYKTQGRLAESYMANVTGLELLRYDIEMAGFGLPISLAAGATYSEASDTTVAYYDPSTLNDSTNNPPRAFAHLNNTGANGSDVLAIKSSAANINPTSKKWSMITHATGLNPTVKLWGVTALDPVMDFTANDRFIILDQNGLLQPSAGPWSCYSFDASAPSTGYYSDSSALPIPGTQYVYYMYGLDNSGGAHRMPFNRVDYYLDKIAADCPSSCAASTYTLYRSTINQANGHLIKTPLIDCVMDFQVAFGLDTDADGNIDTWVQNLNTLTDAAHILAQVREVRVFLLCQEGLGDTSKSAGFRFSGTLNLGDQDIAHAVDGTYPLPPNDFQQLSSSALSGAPQLSSFTPAGADLQYRWKILGMAIKPMNLK